jgi:spore coat protein U-like protein
MMRWILAPLLFVAFSLAQGQTCSFNGSGSAITFSPFDPSVATTQTAFSDLKVKCTPSGFTPTWQFSGTNGNAPLRMKHSTQNAFIPYTVNASFLGNAGVNQNWRITATVLGTNYQDALVGSYSDTLTCTVIP